ncbi:hypothetical protein ACFL1G_09655, partial [Planctomycetota bacterium]
KSGNNARLEDIESVLADLQESLDSRRKKSEHLQELIETDNARLTNSKEARSALSGELAILKDMEKKGEGMGQAVKNILENRSVETDNFAYVEGLLAQKLTVDVEYADAVEAALDGRSESLIVDELGRLVTDKSISKLEGRVNFICLDKIEPFVDKMDLSKFEGVKDRLVEFVKFENRYASLMWKLLGKVIVADSFETATELSERLGDEYKFVTLDGLFISGDGTVKLGPLGKKTGLISRRSRLRQLEETIDKITAEMVTIEARIDKNQQSTEHLDNRCKELRTAIYEANTEKMQVNSKLAAVEQDIKRLTEERPLIAGEIDMLESQIAQSIQTEYNSKQKLDELDAVNKEREAQIKELEAGFAEQKERQKQLTEELTDSRVAVGQVIEQSKALTQTIASVENQLKANLSAQEAAQKEVRLCSKLFGEAQRDILNCEAKVSELYAEKDKSRENKDELGGEIEELIEKKRAAEQLMRQKRAEQEEIEQRGAEVKINLSQLEVKEKTIVERVAEELQMDLAQSYQDYEDHDVDWDKTKEEIAELRGKIERLGNVNLDAINEQEDLENRNEFLRSQVEDLNNSKAQLQQLIKRLNKKSREKFAQSFEEIRTNFHQVFRKLFGGGKADIVLEDAEDILDAEIEIIAKPPGKETRSISLLSGGEKSLTAIALLFAIFKTSPAPFCFLDEIDAALDEANNERFNMMLEEFQRDSQFIIITHSKRTMSIADVLFGITMQRRGVSKKVSVKFGQYEPEAERAAVA